LYRAVLQDARFHALLLRLDADLALEARSGGCRCGGVLHQGNYARKPRGGPSGLGPEHDVRLSLCCARRTCRRRTLPPSLRFLGRRVYFEAVVVLVTALRHGATPERVRELRRVVGISRRTLERWRRWWQTAFAESSFWRETSAAFMPPVDSTRLPASMLERFAGELEAKLLALLRLLAPISGGGAVVHAG
jgi:hypothetical protein